MFESGKDRVEVFNPSLGPGDLELLHAGWEKGAPGFRCGDHVRDCLLVHYVQEGRGLFTQDGRTYTVAPGQLFVIFPGHVVSYSAMDPDQPWVFAWFGFDGSGGKDWLQQAGITPGNPILRLHSDQEFIRTLAACVEDLSSGTNPSNLLARSHLFKLLHLMESECTSVNAALPEQRRNHGESLFREAIAFVASHYHEPITASDVSRNLHVDRSYLWRLFQKYAGLSPQQYLMKYRMDKAAEIISSRSAANLSETARRVGIHDFYYFSRLFKKLKGTAPSNYRAK